MSQVEHRITLDLTSPRSVEPIQLFTNDLSAYVITVKITEYGKEKSLSGYSGAKLVIEGFDTEDFPDGVVGSDNRIRFSLDGVSIQDGWSVCSVRLIDGTTPVETQVFQIYKVVNNPIQVDETPFKTLSQTQLLELVDLANNLEGADAAALRRLKNTASFPSGDTDVDTGLNVDNLQRITYDDIVKLANMALITEVTDDAQHSDSGSRIDNGVLHINPKITDVKLNNTSMVTNGVASVTTRDILPSVSLKDTAPGYREIGTGTIYNNGNLDIVLSESFCQMAKINGETVMLTKEADSSGVYRGTLLFNTLKGVKVGDLYLMANARNPYLELEAGNGISLTPSAYYNKVTIGFDATNGTITVPTSNIEIPAGAANGDILIVNNGELTTQNLADSLDISRTGGDVNIVTTIEQSFDFNDFAKITTPLDTDLQPFLRFEIDDENGIYYLVNGEYTKEEPAGYQGHKYSQVGKKITWSDLMNTFKETHRNEYFTKTLVGSTWGSSTTYTLTITSTELEEHNLTASQVIDEEGTYHTHAHIHPEPDSVYDYSNYGIYCTGAEASEGDVIFTFARNSQITTMPNVAVTIEVRIG